ncbi:MAG TPA: hypothetical protein PLN54_01525 [Flavobacteriales bacterium]|nr:hypothetical protein [Flavobacteriales bacterium]
MGGTAAREFNYLWHQYGRLDSIWAALQGWLDASREDKHIVAQRLISFNAVMLDALWTTLLVGLAAFGDKRNRSGTEPMGIPAWLDRHDSIFPSGSEMVRLQVRADLEDALRRIKRLRNTHLAHWDKNSIDKSDFTLYRAQVTAALGQIEHSFRLIEACFAKDHLMHCLPFNHFGGMRHYMEAVKAWNGNPFE